MLPKQAKFDLKCSKMCWPKPLIVRENPSHHKFLATPLLLYTANGQRWCHGITHCSQHHCPVMKYLGSDATGLFDLQHVLCLLCPAGITFWCNTEFIGAPRLLVGEYYPCPS